ncbi:hypothetical protein FisN_15Hh174 [Fistulifera solaris]|uniref:RING-type domain-containing protein n=1 Tax=Fistulifera solaris TaxID=1519565 RepID=A0A1Z5JG10_FISSO|nr:hypothetical protein FisN_15Hh174 [Fistulifera solaris]|eukprot:GAX12698.1 hypothetical protein FisN_15Hh174 [Fistulifera solaris]
MEEECPICLNSFEVSDIAYPLCCATPTCHFNFCIKCIYNLQQSAADGYQMASDGSNQLKVHFKCPQCREKYQCNTYPSELIVHSVLLLREASTLEPSLMVVDSGLNATILNRRNLFLKSVSMEDLQDATRRLDVYMREIGKETTVPPLDWDLWRPLIAETSEGLSLPAALSSSPMHHEEIKQWSDPTLFYGLDELMTCDEQEFVTHLMVQGEPELLAQGAHILHGILDMTTTSTTQPSFNTCAGSVPRAQPIDPAVLQRVRKLYPLPPRMPRCVRMPRYDLNGRTKPLKFEKDDKLSLIQVRGPAGQLGLRKGDLVTHINGENVANIDEFEAALQQNGDTDDNFWLAVNCDEETAKALQLRYQKMTREKVHFRKHG